MRKYNWDKKVIIKLIVTAVVFVFALQGYVWIDNKYGGAEADDETWRYTWQVCWVMLWVCGIYFLITLRKLLPKQLKTDMLNGFLWLMSKAGQGIHNVVFAIRHALGIPDPPKRTKARDERSFVFDMEDSDLVRRFRNLGGGLKWKDLDNNADKIRFIYIKFINKLMKKGYKFSTILTPLETLEKWKLQGSESAYMFGLYTDARYSGGRRPITDAEVERSSKYMKMGTKIED